MLNNPDKKRNAALPFLMLGLAMMTIGFNNKRDVFLYVGITFLAIGIAFLKASVWGRPKEGRFRRKTDDEELPPQ